MRRSGPGPERPADRTLEQPTPSFAPEYQTGSDYPVFEEGEDIYGPADGGYTGDEELYGEEARYPEEEGGEARPAPEVTRIAPIVSDEDEEDEDDGQSTRAGPPIHLEVISGPDQGKTRRFRGARMVIGRTQGCDFKLSDNSVSRRHLELVLGDTGVLLRDLGSGNGTRVNDQKVDEKLLQDGDEISIGKTRFRFVDEQAALRKKEQPEQAPTSPPSPGAEPAAEPASESQAAVAAPAEAAATSRNLPPLSARRRPVRGARGKAQAPAEAKKKRLLLLGAAGAVLVLAVVLLAALKKPAAPPPNPHAQEAAAKMQLARNALRDQRFAEAISLIDEAEKLMPGADVAHLGEGARRELATQQGFEQVRTLFQAGQFDQAREALAKVPLAVVLNEDARRKVEAELDGAENDYGRRKALEAIEARDAERAAAIVEKLPRAMAEELTPKLEALRAELKAEEEQAEKEARQTAAVNARHARARREAYIEEAFAAVARKFHEGEFSRAALECDRVVATHRGDAGIRARAGELRKWMPLFGRYLEEGQRKYRAGALESAARPLRKARELYEKIGFDGALGPIIDEQLAAASLAAGKAALARNDLTNAADHFRDALKLNPGESRAQQGLDEVRRRAEDLYLDAYMIRDRDPREAAAKFRTVMDVLPKDSETWGKAKNQLSALGQ